jgi:hypothetical protein
LAAEGAGIAETLFAFMDMAEGPLGTNPYDNLLALAETASRGRINMHVALKRNQRQSSGWVDLLRIKPSIRLKLAWTKWESTMREINIKLFRNEELHDWSMEINGRFHEHISNEGLTDLVEGALIVAAKSLIQSVG